MKQTKKSIEANLRNKMASQYKAKTESLEERITKLTKENHDLMVRAHKAEQEKLEMQDRLQQLEDWNTRLQEFMDMSEEDRKVYVENLRAKTELDETLNSLGLVKMMKYFDSKLWL